MSLSAVATPPRARSPATPHGADRQDRDEMLFLGQRCHHDACSLVDFLPLKCQYCRLPFCTSHHPTLLSPLVSPLRPGHACASPLAPTRATLVAGRDVPTPLCPACGLPVPPALVPAPGANAGKAQWEKPEDAMRRHEQACEGVEGRKREARRKREAGESCWKKGCGKPLVVKIRCEACAHDFCPSHRHPQQHICPSLEARATPGSGSGSGSGSGTAPLFGRPPTAPAQQQRQRGQAQGSLASRAAAAAEARIAAVKLRKSGVGGVAGDGADKSKGKGGKKDGCVVG